MGDFNLLRLALVRHVAVPGALGLIVAVVVACSNDAVPVDGQGAGAVTAAVLDFSKVGLIR
jgi:hypothetical protein